jgi:uncharacterized protein YegL
MVDIKATGVTALGEALKLAANKLNRKYKTTTEQRRLKPLYLL